MERKRTKKKYCVFLCLSVDIWEKFHFQTKTTVCQCVLTQNQEKSIKIHPRGTEKTKVFKYFIYLFIFVILKSELHEDETKNH